VLSAEGRALSFGHAGRGDIFGEIATLDGQARTADATALTRVTTTMLARSPLKRLMEARPQLAHAAVALLCRLCGRPANRRKPSRCTPHRCGSRAFY
jgi:CRP-like cAMP-binding protein